jgi:hypothetical protein
VALPAADELVRMFGIDIEIDQGVDSEVVVAALLAGAQKALTFPQGCLIALGE